MTRMLLSQVVGRDEQTRSVEPYERQVRSAFALIGEAEEGGDELVAVLVSRVLCLQEEISALAGHAAETEQQLALVCRQLAEQNPQRSMAYLAAAHEADRFAAHKREEQRRWQLVPSRCTSGAAADWTTAPGYH